MNKIYAGIGSRQTPPEILEEMRKIGRYFAKKGLILRSGGADGADSAFEKGCSSVNGKKEIFYSRDARPWCFLEVQKYMDPGRTLFDSYRSEYVQGLLARNMMQVLGRDGKHPVDFIICWTPGGAEKGGTRFAIRCGKAHGIPIYNLAIQKDREALHNLFLNV